MHYANDDMNEQLIPNEPCVSLNVHSSQLRLQQIDHFQGFSILGVIFLSFLIHYVAPVLSRETLAVSFEQCP